jgi:large subunit ribosomal protein L27
MAHKKGQGSIKNGRDSRAQFRGVKKFGGEHVIPGNILVRQVGNKFNAGRGVGQGKDFTLYALVEGTLKFYRKGHERKSFVAVEPIVDVEPAAAE